LVSSFYEGIKKESLFFWVKVIPLSRLKLVFYKASLKPVKQVFQMFLLLLHFLYRFIACKSYLLLFLNAGNPES